MTFWEPIPPDPRSYTAFTPAAKRGANLFKICETSGHTSLEMLRTYVRDAELFENHAGDGLL
jgi:hypothetical protein